MIIFRMKLRRLLLGQKATANLDSILKRLWCWERLKAGEGDDRGWDVWMASLTRWTWIEQALGVGDGWGGLACCSPWGHKEVDMTEWLNWTEAVQESISYFYLKCIPSSWSFTALSIILKILLLFVSLKKIISITHSSVSVCVSQSCPTLCDPIG